MNINYLAGVSTLWDAGSVYELRIPSGGKASKSGYFNDPAAAAKVVANLDGKFAAIYRTLNPVFPELLAVSNNKIRDVSSATNDAQILRRRVILIDSDPDRAHGIAKISSSNAEKASALEIMDKIADYLGALDFHFTRADSGNGYHLLIPVDMPNDEDHKRLVERFLKALHQQFSTPQAHIDTGVFNASRISKVYNTLAKKGEDMPDRPHRRASVTHLDTNPDPVSVDLIQAVASLIPLEEPKKLTPKTSTTSPDDYTKAQAAIDALSNSRKDTYNEWLEVGMSLYDLGASGLTLWRDWSSKNAANYEEGICDKKWGTFNGSKHLGSLFFMANQDCPGWDESFKRKSPAVTNKPAIPTADNVEPSYEFFGKTAERAKDQMIRWANDPRDIRGVESGIRLLDLRTAGFEYGYMASLLGPTGSGKTTLVIQFAIKFQQQHPVLLISTEMPPLVMAHRMACQIAGVTYMQVRQGKVPPKQLTAAYDQIQDMKIIIMPLNNPTTAQVKATSVKLLERYADLIVIADSGNNIRSVAEGSDSVYATTREAANVLQEIAGAGAFVFATWQTGRNSKDRMRKGVQLMDAKGAGDVEANSAYMLGWDRPWYWYETGELPDPPKCDPGYATLAPLKIRDGDPGAPIELHWEPGKGVYPLEKKRVSPYPVLPVPAIIEKD